MLQTVVILVLVSTAVAICPNGSVYEAYFNKCYKLTTQPLSFLVAQQSCNNIGGNLVSIHSMVENAYVSGIVSTNTSAASYWTGANYLMCSQWSWIAETPMNFTLWAPSQPYDPSIYQCAAVRLQDDAWTKEQCNALKPSVCEIDPNWAPAATCDKTCSGKTTCSPGYILYLGTCKCYKVVGNNDYNGDSYTFSEAQAKCAQEHGMLAKIPDSDTNDFLFTLAKGQATDVWMGLICANGRLGCQWLDGTPLGTFRPFYKQEAGPNYYLVTETDNKAAKYWGYYEPGDMNAYVCQKDPTAASVFLKATEVQPPSQSRISSDDGKPSKVIRHKL